MRCAEICLREFLQSGSPFLAEGKITAGTFFSKPECFHRLPEDELDKNFLLEIKRRVSADSVIVIDHVEYEVDCLFAKQRIPLRYFPDLKDIFIVEADRALTPIRLLNKIENTFVKREKIHLCKGAQE